MAETQSKYHDSLISQDTLDQLMKDAESLGPEAFEIPELKPASAGASYDSDVIDQSEIDALLGLAPVAEKKQPEEAELVSQDDIDAFFASKPSKKSKASGQSSDTHPGIDAAAKDFESGDEFSDLDFVSMEDIEALMKSELTDDDNSSDTSKANSPEDAGVISQEDIDALLGVGKDEIPSKTLDSAEQTEESLISQEDIDALLSGSMGSDRFTSDRDNDQKTGPDETLVSQDDIDKLLAGTETMPETGNASAKDNEKNLISQEDIDKLLMGQPEEKEEPETLIDQEDIDRLLSSAKPMSMEKPDRVQPEKLISQEDIDRLLNEDTAERELLSDKRVLDQVIIEEREPDEEESPAEEIVKAPAKPSRGKKTAVMALSVCIIAVLFAGSFVIVQKQLKTMHKKNKTIAGKQIPGDGTKDSNKDLESLKTYKVSMKDFVVIPPDTVKDKAYVALDLTVEIADAPSNPLKDSEPLFRNVVYEAINKAIVTQGKTELSPDDLKKMLKDALNAALPHGSVSKIDISDFKTG